MRINRELKSLDTEAKGEVLGCRGESEAGDEMFYKRDVRVSSKGPRFLSFDVEVSVGCGGVHPYATRFTLTYDLMIGQQVRWESFLTKTNAHGLTTNPLNSLPIELPAVTSILLEKLYVAGWKDQDGCIVGAVVNDEARTRFFLSAAPEHSGLSVLPADLPSTAASCEYPVVLGKPAMTELGIPEDVQRDLLVPGSR